MVGPDKCQRRGRLGRRNPHSDSEEQPKCAALRPQRGPGDLRLTRQGKRHRFSGEGEAQNGNSGFDESATEKRFLWRARVWPVSDWRSPVSEWRRGGRQRFSMLRPMESKSRPVCDRYRLQNPDYLIADYCRKLRSFISTQPRRIRAPDRTHEWCHSFLFPAGEVCRLTLFRAASSDLGLQIVDERCT